MTAERDSQITSRNFAQACATWETSDGPRSVSLRGSDLPGGERERAPDARRERLQRTGEQAGSASLAALAGQSLDSKSTLGELIVEEGREALFEGRHGPLARRVTIKVIRLDRSRDQEGESLRDAAMAASSLSSPHLARLVDFGRTETGLAYFVYQDSPGAPLRELLKREGPFSPIKAAHIGRQIAKGLAAIHDDGLLHLGISSRSVYVGSVQGDSSHAAVMETGSFAPTHGWHSGRTVERLPELGDPAYTSPEQAAEREPSARSDLYALGIVLYEMLTGAPPFSGRFPREIALKHIIEPVPALSVPVMCEEETRHWRALLEALLAKEPGDRPADAREVAEALRTLREEHRRQLQGVGPDVYQTRSMSLANVGTMLAEIEAGGIEEQYVTATNLPVQAPPAEEEPEEEPPSPWRRILGWLGR